MLRFVSSEEALTPELETSITAASAWVHLVHAGRVKPDNNAGALVIQSFTNTNNEIAALKKEVNILKRELQNERSIRSEADLVLANNMAHINNIMREKQILERNVERVDHANTLLYYCQVCFERQRTMRLAPCGHMATCPECTDKIMDTNGLCPMCRTPVTRVERTYMS
jgi:glutaminase